MNMKSLFALTAMAAVGAASAAVTTGNTLCRIEVASRTANTIVAVPLKTIAGEDTIKLTDLVLTDNLSEDDYMLYNDNGTWKSWEVDGGSWSPVAVSKDGITSTAGNNEALSRGNAFWLVRQDPTKSFYLYGEVAATAGTMPAIPSARSATTYIMMGNTNLASVAINSIVFNGTPVEGDKIAVPTNTGLGTKEYTYKNEKWTSVTWTLVNDVLTPTQGETSDQIPAGQGFWYVAKKTAE